VVSKSKGWLSSPPAWLAKLGCRRASSPVTVNPLSSRPRSVRDHRSGGGADHREDGRGVEAPLGLVLGDDGHRLDLVAAMEGRHLACLVDLDIFGGRDPVDE
jgi:hypothetical protein